MQGVPPAEGRLGTGEEGHQHHEPAEPHEGAWRAGEAGVEVAREDAARRLAHDEYPTRVGEFGQRGVEEDRARVVHGCRRAVLRGER